MNTEISFRDKDLLVMKLLHYFITKEGYNPVILRGVNNEIWLENMDAPYRIIRINTGYIHNNEQYDFDMFKTKKIMNRIKLKTFSLSMNALSFFLDLGENVDLKDENKVDCIKVSDELDIINDDKVNNAFPDIKENLEFNEDGIELFTKITNDINSKNMKDAREAEDVFKEHTPYATYALIAINVIVFILMYLLGNGSEDTMTLLKFGALNKILVLAGDYYRLVTSAFLHIGFWHLVCNMYALYILGRDIESYFGTLKYLFIYLMSAIIGNLISLLFLGDYVTSAGASGAVFGLMGALLYFGYNYRVTLNNAITKQILPVIILNLAIGFAASGINNFAHIGGLIGGAMASMAVGVKYKSSKQDKINGTIVLTILLILLIYKIFI